MCREKQIFWFAFVRSTYTSKADVALVSISALPYTHLPSPVKDSSEFLPILKWKKHCHGVTCKVHLSTKFTFIYFDHVARFPFAVFFSTIYSAWVY